MSEEKPLKGISKDIAEHLGVCPKVAAQVLKQYKVPTFKLGRYRCCYASTLNRCLDSQAESSNSTEKQGTLYFIQAEDRAIKIGWTGNAKKRIAGLRGVIPMKLKLLGIIKGLIKDEERLHDKFKEYRLNGEWFKLAEPILIYIQELCKPNEH